MKHVGRPRHHLPGGGAPSRSRASLLAASCPSGRRRRAALAARRRPTRRRSLRRARAGSAALRRTERLAARRDAHRPAEARGHLRANRPAKSLRAATASAVNTRYLRAGHAGRRHAPTAPARSPRELVVPPRRRSPAAPGPLATPAGPAARRSFPGRPTPSSCAGRFASSLYQAIARRRAPYLPGRAKRRAGVGARRHLRVSRRHEPRPPAGRRVPRPRRALGRAHRRDAR